MAITITVRLDQWLDQTRRLEIFSHPSDCENLIETNRVEEKRATGTPTGGLSEATSAETVIMTMSFHSSSPKGSFQNSSSQ